MMNLIQKLRQDWAKRDQELVNNINDIIKKQKLNGQISAIEQYKQTLSHLYQKSSSYTNIVILAGYAGIFGIWQITHELLNKQMTIWVALFVSCSLTLFVGYEIWKMIAESLFFRNLNKIIESSVEEQERISVWQHAFTEYARKQSRIWPYFLIPTVLFGFSAGFMLIYQFVINL